MLLAFCLSTGAMAEPVQLLCKFTHQDGEQSEKVHTFDAASMTLDGVRSGEWKGRDQYIITADALTIVGHHSGAPDWLLKISRLSGSYELYSYNTQKTLWSGHCAPAKPAF